MKYTIGGNVTLWNPIDLDYCFVPCILSLLPVCDVVQVIDSTSDDGSRKILHELSEEHPQITVLDYPHDMSSGHIDAIIDKMNYNRERLPTHYNMHLEADEVLGPESYDYILKRAEEPNAVLGMHRLNFWEDHQHVLWPGQILSHQVIRFAPKTYFMGGDAPHSKATQTEPEADWSAMQHCKIYHYGFLREPKAYLRKYVNVMRVIHGTEYADPVSATQLIGAIDNGRKWMHEFHLKLERFNGNHPPLACEWLNNRGYITYPPKEVPRNGSETAKYRHLTTRYCYGSGVDVASQGDPVVPWAWSFDLPVDQFAFYNSNHSPRGPIPLRGHGGSLPVDSNSLDFVYSSHLLEDFEDWTPLLTEWVRVIKPGGYLVVLIPERDLWNTAVANGQPPNCAHRHEGKVGELSTYADKLGLKVIEDRLTDCFAGDYSILFVGQKNS